MTQPLKSSTDPIQTALLRVKKSTGKPGIGTLTAIALLSANGEYSGDRGAGKASGMAVEHKPSPSATRRAIHLEASRNTRAEYIRLGIIKPLV